jgi:hypothetical protein
MPREKDELDKIAHFLSDLVRPTVTWFLTIVVSGLVSFQVICKGFDISLYFWILVYLFAGIFGSLKVLKFLEPHLPWKKLPLPDKKDKSPDEGN